MIDDLLDASRLQAGRLPIEPRRSPRRARRPRGRQGPARRSRPAATPSRSGSPTSPSRSSRTRSGSSRSLDNLLENAARYSDPGSPIEVDLLAEDGHALLSVTNAATASPTAELEQIFEPFYRGADAKQRGVRGAGLGLAICRGIVEAHGGKIWAENGDDHRRRSS